MGVVDRKAPFFTVIMPSSFHSPNLPPTPSHPHLSQPSRIAALFALVALASLLTCIFLSLPPAAPPPLPLVPLTAIAAAAHPHAAVTAAGGRGGTGRRLQGLRAPRDIKRKWNGGSFLEFSADESARINGLGGSGSARDARAQRKSGEKGTENTGNSRWAGVSRRGGGMVWRVGWWGGGGGSHGSKSDAVGASDERAHGGVAESARALAVTARGGRGGLHSEGGKSRGAREATGGAQDAVAPGGVAQQVEGRGGGGEGEATGMRAVGRLADMEVLPLGRGMGGRRQAVAGGDEGGGACERMAGRAGRAVQRVGRRGALVPEEGRGPANATAPELDARLQSVGLQYTLALVPRNVSHAHALRYAPLYRAAPQGAGRAGAGRQDVRYSAAHAEVWARVVAARMPFALVLEEDALNRSEGVAAWQARFHMVTWGEGKGCSGPRDALPAALLNLMHRLQRVLPLLQQHGFGDVVVAHGVDKGRGHGAGGGAQGRGEEAEAEAEGNLGVFGGLVGAGAVSVTRRSIKWHKLAERRRERLTRGEVACALSHYLVWLEVLRRKLPYAIILEDDVTFTTSTFRADFERNIAEANELLTRQHSPESPPDILFVGHMGVLAGHFMPLLSPHIAWDPLSWCSFAYIISHRGAERLVAGFKVDDPLDSLWWRRPNLAFWAFQPPLAFHLSSPRLNSSVPLSPPSPPTPPPPSHPPHPASTHRTAHSGSSKEGESSNRAEVAGSSRAGEDMPLPVPLYPSEVQQGGGQWM
ncbi:unnamed protein product [Closterium sp. Yama58-4]|nr:unnamed protein product [Closterium sp. Yama58-4]